MRKLKVAGLFAGIGGIEYGLHRSGMETVFLCELDSKAQEVLRQHFPKVPVHDDITTLQELPEVDVITAGFPCQNLSQAGLKALPLKIVGAQRHRIQGCRDVK